MSTILKELVKVALEEITEDLTGEIPIASEFLQYDHHLEACIDDVDEAHTDVSNLISTADELVEVSDISTEGLSEESLATVAKFQRLAVDQRYRSLGVEGVNLAIDADAAKAVLEHIKVFVKALVKAIIRVWDQVAVFIHGLLDANQAILKRIEIIRRRIQASSNRSFNLTNISTFGINIGNKAAAEYMDAAQEALKVFDNKDSLMGKDILSAIKAAPSPRLPYYVNKHLEYVEDNDGISKNYSVTEIGHLLHEIEGGIKEQDHWKEYLRVSKKASAESSFTMENAIINVLAGVTDGFIGGKSLDRKRAIKDLLSHMRELETSGIRLARANIRESSRMVRIIYHAV